MQRRTSPPPSVAPSKANEKTAQDQGGGQTSIQVTEQELESLLHCSQTTGGEGCQGMLSALLERCQKKKKNTREKKPLAGGGQGDDEDGDGCCVEVDWRYMYEDLHLKHKDLSFKSQGQQEEVDSLSMAVLKLEYQLGDLANEKKEVDGALGQAEERVNSAKTELLQQTATAKRLEAVIADLREEVEELRKPKSVLDQAAQCLLFDPALYTRTKQTASAATQSTTQALGSHGCQTLLEGPVVSTKEAAPIPTCHVLTQTQVTGPVWRSDTGAQLAMLASEVASCNAYASVLPLLPASQLGAVRLDSEREEYILRVAEELGGNITAHAGEGGLEALLPGLPPYLAELLSAAPQEVASFTRQVTQREEQLAATDLSLGRVHAALGWLQCGSLLANGQVGGMKSQDDATTPGAGDHTMSTGHVRQALQFKLSGSLGDLQQEIFTALQDEAALDTELATACKEFQCEYRALQAHCQLMEEADEKLNRWVELCVLCIKEISSLREGLVVISKPLPQTQTSCSSNSTVSASAGSSGAGMELYHAASPGLQVKATQLLSEAPSQVHPTAIALKTEMGLLHADFYACIQQTTRDFLRGPRQPQLIANLAVKLKAAKDGVTGATIPEEAWGLVAGLATLPRMLEAEDEVLSSLKEWLGLDIITTQQKEEERPDATPKAAPPAPAAPGRGQALEQEKERKRILASLRVGLHL